MGKLNKKSKKGYGDDESDSAHAEKKVKLPGALGKIKIKSL
jgi:hypothetical protein